MKQSQRSQVLQGDPGWFHRMEDSRDSPYRELDFEYRIRRL